MSRRYKPRNPNEILLLANPPAPALRHRTRLHLRSDRAGLRADLQGHRDRELRAGRTDDGWRLLRLCRHVAVRPALLARGAAGGGGDGGLRRAAGTGGDPPDPGPAAVLDRDA